MDAPLIGSVTLNQLHGVTGLNSLKIQNHIYGCYVIMEDISQGKLSVIGKKIIGPKISFDLDTRFSEIGIRFGFLTDTKLILDVYSTEYKREWLTLFVELSHTHSVDKSDTVEDFINEHIVREIKPEDAFFLNAIETGMLQYEWLDKAILLLTGTIEPLSSSEIVIPNDEEVPVEDTAITHAHTEKVSHGDKKRRNLATTRRHKETIVVRKKLLSITRRNHGSKENL